MSLSLRTSDTVKYSDRETRIFNLLVKAKGRMTTEQLIKGLYKGREAPFNARNSTMGAMRSLKRKMEANREPFQIMNTALSGPHSMEFWIEQNKRRSA